MSPQEGVPYDRPPGVSVRTIQPDWMRAVALPRHACVDQLYTFNCEAAFVSPVSWPTSRVTCPWRGSSGAQPQSLAAWLVAVVGADIVGSG